MWISEITVVRGGLRHSERALYWNVAQDTTQFWFYSDGELLLFFFFVLAGEIAALHICTIEMRGSCNSPLGCRTDAVIWFKLA